MKKLLWFINRVDEDGAIACIRKDIAKDFLSKTVDFTSGDEKIEPWMWNFPQAFWPEFDLGNVNPV